MYKVKKRKLLFSFVLLFIVSCIFSSTLTVSAGIFRKEDIPIPNVQKDIYVYDEDNIIDDDVETTVNALLVQLEEKTGAEVAVITVESLLDKDIEDYSYELANTLGIGKADEDNGVLLLISKPDSKVRLEIGSGLEGCLNDSKCGRILDNYFVPYREKDEYSEGTYKTIEAVVSVIAQEYKTTIGEIDETIASDIEKQEAEARKKTVATIVIIIIIVIVLLFCDNVFWGGVVLESLLDSISSSSGGRSGGGFGGGGFRGGGATR